MHSRIFKIGKAPEFSVGGDCDREYLTDICPDDYFDHWFTHQVADYVAEDPDNAESVSWLFTILIFGGRASLISADREQRSFTLLPGYKEAFFADRFEAFSTTLDKLKECTLRDFSLIMGVSDIAHLMFQINDEYTDKQSFYIESCEGEYSASYLVPFDTFIRTADIGHKYIVGGSLDYHI